MLASLKAFAKGNSRYYLFLLVATLFYGLVFTITDFWNNPFNNYVDLFIIILQWSIISTATFGLIYALSLHRYLFAVTFPLLTILCAILAYFRFTANVSFTPMILDSALDNDLRTGIDLISVDLICFLLVCLACSVLLIIYRFKKIKPTFISFHVILAIFLLLFINFFFFSIQKPVSERLPFILFYTAKKYIAEKKEMAIIRKELSQRAVCKQDSLTVVCILGEALRSDHLSINGYHRNTTPYLEQEKVTSFFNIYSEYTHTNRSLPHLLTRADSIYTNRAFEEASFIHIFKSCGYHTTWLANQESAETYVYFMKEADELHYANAAQSVYNYDKWLDADLLPYLDKTLQQHYPQKLIVLHTIGSHWWYNSHFSDSFQRFDPVVKSKIISSCTKEEIINSYDNTIVYSDFFYKQVIERLKDKKAILIYLSDHGEALGENNEWLHAHSNSALHRPACFIWMSPSYQATYPDKYKAALKNAPLFWRTDILFHTMLGAGEIQSPFRVEGLNVLTYTP